MAAGSIVYSVAILAAYFLKMCMLWKEYTTACDFERLPNGILLEDLPNPSNVFRSRLRRATEIYVQLYLVSILSFLSLLSLHVPIDYWICKRIQVYFVSKEFWCAYGCLIVLVASLEALYFMCFVFKELLVGLYLISEAPEAHYQEIDYVRAVVSEAFIKSYWRTKACVFLLFVALSLDPSVVFYTMCIWSIIDGIGWPYCLFGFKGCVPLPEEQSVLRARITTVAFKIKFPLREVYVHDERDIIVCGPKRCICLSRQLIQDHDINEVVAAVAHHLMMWSHNFTVYTFLAYQGYRFLVYGFYLCVAASKSLFRDMGFDGPVPVGLMFGVFLRIHLICFEDLASLAYHYIKRLCIFKADRYVGRLGMISGGGGDYVQSLRSYLTRGDVSGQQYWPFNRFLNLVNFDSPTVAERVAQLDGIRSRRRRNRRRDDV